MNSFYEKAMEVADLYKRIDPMRGTVALHLSQTTRLGHAQAISRAMKLFDPVGPHGAAAETLKDRHGVFTLMEKAHMDPFAGAEFFFLVKDPGQLSGWRMVEDQKATQETLKDIYLRGFLFPAETASVEVKVEPRRISFGEFSVIVDNGDGPFGLHKDLVVWFGSTSTPIDQASSTNSLAWVDYKGRAYTPSTIELDGLQENVRGWVEKLGSRPVDLQMRLRRFAEESAELCQAGDLDFMTYLKVVTDAYSRPKGEVGQEFGGALMTMLALANVTGHSLWDQVMTEFNRVNTPEMIEKIRAKQKTKEASGL